MSSSSVSNTGNPVGSFFERFSQKATALTAFVVSRARLLDNSEERKEYTLFYEVKRLSQTDHDSRALQVFKKKVTDLSNLISDAQIASHVKRLSPSGEELGDQPYFASINANEKAVIKAHEVFEMLWMKWELGIAFDQRDKFSAFWPAHTQAVCVENLFLMALAREQGIELSKTSLEYCRFVDDFYLNSPFATGFSLDLAETEKNLTKNIQKLPKAPEEIDCFCDFFSWLTTRFDYRSKIGLLQRYLYSSLYQLHETKKVYLIVLLRRLEKDQVYHNYPLSKIQTALNIHLQEYGLPHWCSEKSLLDNGDFFYKDLDLPYSLEKQYQTLLNIVVSI